MTGRERFEEKTNFGERESWVSFEDREIGLTGITNWSDWSPLTDRINSPKLDYLLSRKNLMTRSEGISKS
jgi:hypothetical protein